MKHAGKATQAALKLVYWTLFFLLALLLTSVLARLLGAFIVQAASGLAALWAVFCLFCFFFFRDPDRNIPAAAGLVVAPADGKVDLIEEVEEVDVMGVRCRRISIFLSVFDVHVQRAPVAGQVLICRHTPGRFLNAMRTDSARYNENTLLLFESADAPGERVAVRLVAGLIARRIVAWAQSGEAVARGERISLIQFGSRCDLYLPLGFQVKVPLNARVRAGETVLATRS